MRHISKVVAAVVFVATPAVMFCASGLAVPDVTVGRNLEMYASVKLPEAAPRAGLPLTVTSDDPTRLLLSQAPDQAGSTSITLTVNSGLVYSPEFWVQGLADNGSATYNVTANGLGTAKGKVTFVPSAIVIMGPLKAPSFQTTPRGRPSKLVLISATLDSSMKVSQEQLVAGGSRLTVRIENSHTESGTVLGESAVTLMGGESEAATYFKPAAEGKATLTPVPPPGFRASADYASVVATVEKPGIAVADELIIGKDLQVLGGIALGEPAGPEGVKVTLTSSDASKLLLSTAEDKLGSGTITLTVPPGQFAATYFLQALSDTGLVTHQATAPGFRTRIGHTQLAPSGVIVGYSKYGPPDEAAVKRRIGGSEERSFYVSLADSKKNPIHVMVWSAYLDSGLAADFTVEALRPGVSATVMLKSSDPAVGTVESPVTIHSGSNRAASRFTPMKPGKTVISIDTPSGFATPKNAVYVPAFVSD